MRKKKKKILSLVLALLLALPTTSYSVLAENLSETEYVETESAETESAETEDATAADETEPEDAEDTEAQDEEPMETETVSDVAVESEAEETEEITEAETETVDEETTDVSEASADAISAEASDEAADEVSDSSAASLETSLSDGSEADQAVESEITVQTEASSAQTTSSYTEITITSEEGSTSTSFYKALKAALDEAQSNATSSKPYKIIIEPGTYTLTKTIYIPSNTYLYAVGCTIKINHSGAGIRTGTDASGIASASGYEYKNITIEGGTWNKCAQASTLFQICHAKNVTVTDATFTNSKNGHLMEIAGVYNVTVSNCSFTKQILTSTSKTTYEAIQIDILQEDHLVGYAEEDLANKKITIEDCTFKNVPRGVGSHTAILNNPINSLTITGNTFTDIGSAAIQLMGVKNCTISDNTISDAARGIFVYSYRTTGTFLGTTLDSSSTTSKKCSSLAANTKITGNTVKLNSSEDEYDTWQKAGILVGGLELSTATEGASGVTGNKLPKGNYYISGVTVKNNTVTVASKTSQGIRLNDVYNSTVSGNTVKCTKTSSENYWGITVSEGCSGITVKSNKITGFYDSIVVRVDSTAKSITSNTITSPVRHGIWVYNESQATTISSNTIKCKSKTSSYGILVRTGQTAIKSNKISGCLYPVYLDSAVTGSISYNTLSSNAYNKYNIAGTTQANLGKPTLTIGTKKKTSIKMSWTKKSGKGYQIYRATSKSGTYSKVKTIKKNTTLSYTNTGLTKNKTYYYKVRAYKVVGNITVYGAFSTVKSGKTKSA